MEMGMVIGRAWQAHWSHGFTCEPDALCSVIDMGKQMKRSYVYIGHWSSLSEGSWLVWKRLMEEEEKEYIWIIGVFVFMVIGGSNIVPIACMNVFNSFFFSFLSRGRMNNNAFCLPTKGLTCITMVLGPNSRVISW